jgi:hypothetical protein
MFEIRAFRVGDAGCVVALRGELDIPAAAEAVTEIDRHRPGHVIVDLLRTHIGDLDAVDMLVAAAGPDSTFVAERPVLDGLHVVGLRRYVHTAPTLAAALG